MKCFKSVLILAGCSFAYVASAGVFTIGGFTFDEQNTPTKAVIVEGPKTLIDHSSSVFGRFSEEYVKSPTTRTNTFEKFDRSRSVGRLLGRTHAGKTQDYARYISMPDFRQVAPKPNVDRCTIELSWGESRGVKNESGPDFVVFESGRFEGFEVAVRKAGSDEFTAYRYQFPKEHDAINDANPVAFDLSDFGLSNADSIIAIRIRNIFNSKAAVGADKVDNATGEGNVVYPADSQYDKAFTLLTQAGGQEFPVDRLGADIVYVAVLHQVEAVKAPEAPAEVATQPAPTAAQTNRSSAAKATAPKRK